MAHDGFVDPAELEPVKERALGMFQRGSYHRFWLDAGPEREPVVYHQFIAIEKGDGGRKRKVPYTERWIGWPAIMQAAEHHKSTATQDALIVQLRSTWNEHWAFVDAMRGA